MTKKRCVIIGGGLAGLSIGLLMASAQFEVTIIEKNSWWGGKFRRLYFGNGDYIDSGPSLLTFPGILTRYIELLKVQGVLFSDQDELQVSPFNNVGLYAFSNNIVDLQRDQSLQVEWQQYLNKYDDAAAMFEQLLMLPPRSLTAVLLVWRQMQKYGFTNLQRFLNRHKFSQQLKDIIAIHTLNLGKGPSEIPALFAGLLAAFAQQKIHYFVGGTYRLIEVLLSLLKQQKVILRENESVVAIKQKNIITDKQEYQTDIIINAIDYERFLQLSARQVPQLFTRSRLTTAAIALYGQLSQFPTGLDTKFLDEHVVLMPSDMACFYEYLTQNTRKTDSMAFCSFHPSQSLIYGNNQRPCFSLIVTASPDGRGLEYTDQLLQTEINRLQNSLGLRNLAQQIVEPKVLSPQYYSQFGSKGGALYGRGFGLLKSGPFHPVRYQDKQYDYIWHVGTSIHPGGGIPAILSGVMQVYSKLSNYF